MEESENDKSRKAGATSPVNTAGTSLKLALLALCLAQFINAYDTTAMSVAVSRIVGDLHTTVTGVQSALTIYSLVMAAFMIIGSKLGDRWGRKRVFTIGVAMYGAGALITALSPNLTIMIGGWSLLEGLGSALMIPAIYAMISVMFPPGKRRVKAFAIVGSMAAAGAACGPLLCGFLTTYLSWRVSFASEVVVVLLIIALQRKLAGPKEERGPRLDLAGAALSALGLGLVVTGVLQANAYGWLKARKAFKIRGWVMIPKGGVSPVIVFVIAGFIVLVLFVLWQRHRKRVEKTPLIDLSIFRNRAVSAGLPAIIAQMFMQAGILFIVPVFLQIALGFSALRAGLTIIPLTVALILTSQLVGKLTERFSQKKLVQVGMLMMSLGVLVSALTMRAGASNLSFVPGLLIIGFGIGLVNAPLINLVQSAVPAQEQGDISGLSRAMSNLGGSLGTAVAGAVLVAALISTGQAMVSQSTVIPDSDKPVLEQAIEDNAQTMTNEELNSYLEQQGSPQDITGELDRINTETRDGALRSALISVGVLGLFGFAASFLLPGRGRKREEPEAQT